MEFKRYDKNDYEAVCDFLTALNRDDKSHINWNWARFEWMAEHPECDKSAFGSIGLWTDEDRIVGAAIYDMYFGEAFCAALSGYDRLYPEILDYAFRELRDDAGLAIAICDESEGEIAAAEASGFTRIDQTETVMRISLDGGFTPRLTDGLRFGALDPAKDPYAFQWLLWQGFDHGTDREAFEQNDPLIVQIRPHFDPRLSLTAVDSRGESVAYCCLWYSDKTDYAYVEPVCVVPAYRGKGIAKALLFEAFNRAFALGAKRAYVISDTPFYQKLGFETDRRYSFYLKKGEPA